MHEILSLAVLEIIVFQIFLKKKKEEEKAGRNLQNYCFAFCAFPRPQKCLGCDFKPLKYQQ